MKRKNRTGVWLSLATFVLAAVLVLTAFNSINFPSAEEAVMRSEDPFNLKFDANCLDCHYINLPDITWYCHDSLPAESYASRLYLIPHLYWITSTLPIPRALYFPLVEQLPQNEIQVHLFKQSSFPVNANITVGMKVTWTNLDTRDLTLESNSPAYQGKFASIVLKPGESTSYIFEAAGVFNYKYLYIDYGYSGVDIYQTAVGKITIAEKK